MERSKSKFIFSYKPDESLKNFGAMDTYAEFEFDENMMHISEFHKLCKKFARLYGFADKSIEEYFGEDQENPLID